MGLPKIKYAKLGRYHAWGLYKDGKIKLDERLKGKKHLEILIHEILHHIEPKWDEVAVTNHAQDIACVLWAEGYRVK